MPISAGNLSGRPLMDLMYKVKIARPSESTSTTTIDPALTYTILPALVRCDIMPLADQDYFAQAGMENIATHVLHFYAKTDIRPRDKVQFVTNRRLAGPVGSWYEIMDYLGPAETIAYIRCHARLTDAPT